jgi:dTDP-glucose pyrophosphorylase
MTHLRDLDCYYSRLGISIREALVRLNGTRHLFQLVVDSDGLLCGTVTDGDVRRALLRGVTLESPVEDCMHVDFVAGRAGDDRSNEALLGTGQRPVTFLPVLDSEGVVVEVLVRDVGSSRIAQALVMAGGYGRRLGHRTRETPKPLLHVGSRPILEHVLNKLEMSGIRKIYVSVHYRADQIKRFLEDRDSQAEVEVVEEIEPLGTAGALALIGNSGGAPILVVNGDVITQADFVALHDFHVRHALDATIGVARYDIDVPFGILRYGEDGLFAGIDEKPRISNFIAAGLYYLGPEFTALVPIGKAVDMPELLNLGKRVHLKIGLFPIHEFWADVGQPNDLEAVDRVVRGGAR